MLARIAATTLAVFLATASQASTQTVASIADVIRTFGNYCIGTDGKAEKAEAAIMQLQLPPGAASVAPSRGGVSLGIDMGQSLKLGIEMEPGGLVRVCDVRAEVDNIAGLFALLRTTYNIGGTLGDYDVGNKEWAEIQTPGGTKMSGNFIFSPAEPQAADKHGAVRLTLLPAD